MSRNTMGDGGVSIRTDFYNLAFTQVNDLGNLADLSYARLTSQGTQRGQERPGSQPRKGKVALASFRTKVERQRNLPPLEDAAEQPQGFFAALLDC
jgi:hypothetical protein